jgi:DNA-binding CsgD family transcriptional regulator
LTGSWRKLDSDHVFLNSVTTGVTAASRNDPESGPHRGTGRRVRLTRFDNELSFEEPARRSCGGRVRGFGVGVRSRGETAIRGGRKRPVSGHDRIRAFSDRTFRDPVAVIPNVRGTVDAAEPACAVVARFELRSVDGIAAAEVRGSKVGRGRPADRATRSSSTAVHRSARPTEADPSDRSAKRRRRTAGAEAELSADHRVVVAATADGATTGLAEADLLRLLVSAAESRLAEIAERSAGPAGRPVLSPRERECVQWTAAGKTTWEIAGILEISTNTVDGYIASATRKLGAVNRTQAAVEALRRAIID